VPDYQAHLDQAARNEGFLVKIDVSLHSDWAVTVLFYAALHYVDAYLAKAANQHPGNHDERDRLIQSHSKTSAARPYYRRLKDRATEARYQCTKTITPATVSSLRTNDFEPLKQKLS